MPGEHQKDASKPSRRNPRRGSSSAGPPHPNHAARYERPHPPINDGRTDSEAHRYNDTTPPILPPGGCNGNFAAHRDLTMEQSSTKHSMTPYPDGYALNNAGVASHSEPHSTGSTLHHPSSNQWNGCPLRYDTSSGNAYADAWGSSATDGAVNYGDPLSTVGRETAPTDRPQWTSASRVDGQYASSGAHDLRANDSSGEAGLYITDAHGYPVTRNVRYSFLGPCVGNENPVPAYATAAVDINQPAQITADHSPPSSVGADMGSAEASPVQQQREFEVHQGRWPVRDGRVEVPTAMDEMVHWSFADEGPWNPYDATWRYHY
ncbi:hypothetical protein DL770_010852 [Monosporascus sp. CRB-9-2]|nr:hypothetical protein DL770_010852 [Monosporascus sp. CRB-9-2]